VVKDKWYSTNPYNEDNIKKEKEKEDERSKESIKSHQ
jgi:hypothetical protein